jgi:ATP-dependent phosphofructokinase / diphosphate-dependent phosphofructokinase
VARAGNLLVGQGGGPTAVINASLLGIVEAARQQQPIEYILGMRYGLVGLLNDELIDLGQEDADHLRMVGRSPSAALGTCRRRFTARDADVALSMLAAHNIRFFLYIGGNDSADTAHQIQVLADEHGYELSCLGVPKTIDNDLAQMDHTPGYGSAARYVAMATLDCGYDASSIATTDQVTILEVMGRNAGWLAAASILARNSADDAPHLVYVPEQPVAAGTVVQQVNQVMARYGHAVIVVTETIRKEDGEPWARRTGDDGFGHARLVGAAEQMAALIGERLGLKVRFNKPGSLQRSSGLCISELDWNEAYLAGKAAVEQAVAGARDVMITLLRQPGPTYACSTGLAPLVDVAHAERRLPPEFLAGDGQISAAFAAYARPLIGDGLPRYARLAASSKP